MLQQLDNLLRDHLLRRVATLNNNPQQVRFQPPDDSLLTEVRNIGEMVVSLYLMDLREDRRLRSNERETDRRNGDAFSTRRPDRLECHYLLNAWSPAQATPAIEPTLDEHALLYQATAAFFQHTPLVPDEVYPVGAPELSLWGRFVSDSVPMQVAPPEGFPGLGEFWTAMGQDARWRPSLHLVATIPVELLEVISGPLVTTRLAAYHQLGGGSASGDVLIQIGGTVLDTTTPGGPTPLANVAVNIEDPVSNRLIAWKRTNELGRFDFLRLPAGRYQLRTRGVGLPVLTRVIDVPAESGEYDLQYT